MVFSKGFSNICPTKISLPSLGDLGIGTGAALQICFKRKIQAIAIGSTWGQLIVAAMFDNWPILIESAFFEEVRTVVQVMTFLARSITSLLQRENHFVRKFLP